MITYLCSLEGGHGESVAAAAARVVVQVVLGMFSCAAVIVSRCRPTYIVYNSSSELVQSSREINDSVW